MKLGNCDCEHEESGKGVGSVKGYVLVSECNVCRENREDDNDARIAKQRDMEEARLKEALIQAHLHEMAEAELKIDGKLTSEGLVNKEIA